MTEVADQMEQWFKEDACDGFNFLAPVFPIGLNDFVDLVVPELQRRGLYRTAMKGRRCATSRAAGPAKPYARGSAGAEYDGRGVGGEAPQCADSTSAPALA